MFKFDFHNDCDFMQLPPAQGKSQPLNQDVGGHIVVVQAADLASTRKIVPVQYGHCIRYTFIQYMQTN